MPLTFVNSQFEPLRVDRSVAWYLTRILTVAPAARMPPRPTMMVWSLTRRATLTPSTWT